jgi:opacity protein-like surface antigen
MAAAVAVLLAPLAANAQPVAPGFYIGVGGGLNGVNVPGVGGEKLGFNVTGYLGYDFVGPMVEVEGAYRRNKVRQAYLNQWSGMVNVLYEFAPENPFAFHVGIGAGIADGSVNNGANFDLPTKFAMQGLIGGRYRFDSGLFIRTDLKFQNVFLSGKDLYNFGGTISVGYKFGPPAPAAAPPPPPPTSAQYIVFFDFDRATLTAQALTTIKQAAAAAKAGNKTRIGVTGHADRSGSDAYNMALSLRRANAVKDQLVREGIPAAGITVVGRGESQPLVPTADGVREPQNRRVEIVLQ